MLALLSSGASPRYRDDIIRALALPAGADLQFRYDRRHIDDALLVQIDAGNVHNEPALVLYLSSDRENLATELVPCRFVNILSAELEGSSCIIRFRVGGFVRGLSDAQFRASLNESERALVPRWEAKAGTAPVLLGKFFFPFRSDLAQHETKDRRAHIEAFETTVAALVSYKDFSDEKSTVFYAVLRLVELGKSETKARNKIGYQLASGFYSISSGKRYEIEVLCFLPPSAQVKLAKLHIHSDVEAVEFPLGKVRNIDNRYDVKSFVLRVQRQTETVSAGLQLYLTGADNDKPYSDITIPVLFKASVALALLRFALLTVGTAGSGMIAAQAAGKLDLVSFLLILVCGALAGAGTVWPSFKKS